MTPLDWLDDVEDRCLLDTLDVQRRLVAALRAVLAIEPGILGRFDDEGETSAGWNDALRWMQRLIADELIGAEL